MENLTLTKIAKLIRKNIKLISVFTLGALLVGSLYALLIFKPIYKSTSKLIIKNPVESTFISELGVGGSSLSSLSRTGNPALTQIGIITSKTIAQQVWRQISPKYNMTENEQIGTALMQKAIEVKNPIGTDIIEITASWENPDIAKDIAEGFQNAYVESNIQNAKKSVVQSQNTIATELETAQQKLAEVREQIRGFRQSFSTVDIATEAQNITIQSADLENRYSEMLSNAAAEANKSKTIAKQLGINWKDAVDSVALGHNPVFSTLQTKLGETREEYAELSSKYTEAHPKMQSLQSRINGINQELENQIKLTIGEEEQQTEISKTEETEKVIVTDPVRTRLVDDFAATEASARGYMAQSAVLSRALGNLKAKRKAIPDKQLVLANLTQQEANWATVVDTLKAKQIEANIKEAEILSNIDVIDNPGMPIFANFPGKTSVALLFGLIGLCMGVGSTLLNYIFRGTIDSIEELEEETEAPILGVIPWLENEMFGAPQYSLASDNTSSYYSLAYQKAVTSIDIRGFNTGAKTLAFTSSEYSKTKSTILSNIAYALTKAGNSVVVVDADFRTPTVHKEFGAENIHLNLANLISKVSSDLKSSNEINLGMVASFIQPVGNISKLNVITNRDNINEPSEFLNSKVFKMVIKYLKENYDWVLIDTPPALAVPDAVTVGTLVDGVVLTAGLNTTRKEFIKVQQMFKNNNINLFGIIGREVQVNEAASSNEYIKQIISRMMPEDDAFAQK